LEFLECFPRFLRYGECWDLASLSAASCRRRFRPCPWGTRLRFLAALRRLRQVSQWGDDLGESFDESPVKIRKPDENPYIAHTRRFQPGFDGVNAALLHSDALR